jgi:hypothetical protein
MTPALFKILGTAAALVILIGRFFLRLRGLEGDARDRALKKAMQSDFLAIGAVAGLLLYLVFTRS